ncbi:MAG: hypothetical protein FWE74_01675 [Oscillospiraceae bacterium]|nr:hypothetical protein [Oscillospiraceae bacterium]
MRNILIVCTANQTRSLMAMEVANHIAQISGKADELRFDSAGTAVMGSESDPAAKRLLAEAGIESTHSPTHFSYLELDDYDEIHVMTGRHKTALCAYNKSADLERKIKVLNVDDPYGRGTREYQSCLEKLKGFYEKFING